MEDEKQMVEIIERKLPLLELVGVKEMSVTFHDGRELKIVHHFDNPFRKVSFDIHIIKGPFTEDELSSISRAIHCNK